MPKSSQSWFNYLCGKQLISLTTDPSLSTKFTFRVSYYTIACLQPFYMGTSKMKLGLVVIVKWNPFSLFYYAVV